MPRCYTFRQLSVKMPHFSACMCIYMCMLFCQGFACSSPRACRVCMYMCMPRCHTFRQLSVKMSHLSAGMCIYLCMLFCQGVACSSPRICTFVVCVCTCVCQGVTPFSSSQSRCLIFRLACVLIRLLCLMFHLACGMCKFVYMFMLHYFTQLAYV